MTKLNRRKTLFFISFVIILPISLSLGCLFLMLHKKAVSNEGLHFSSHHIDLGELNYGQDVTANFPFRNTASKPIRITKLHGDCRCTDIESDKKVVLPGETGAVTVIFRSANRRGPETHNVVVLTDSPQQELIKLTLSAVVDPHIELIPRALSFGRVGDLRHVKSREVSIISRFREPARTISVSSSNPHIKATLLDLEPAHSREAGRIRVELSGKAPSGKLESDIKVTTRTEKGIVNNSLKVVAEILTVADAASL